MWFLCGVLCGVLIGVCLTKRHRRREKSPMETARREPSEVWVQTRNFLYYDGTEMPVMKENANEQ